MQYIDLYIMSLNFIGDWVPIRDGFQEVEMDDQLLGERKEYAKQNVVLKVSSWYYSNFIIMFLSFFVT